jgi:dolichyl-phosphate-mannose-protein mannosyltransferase
MNGGSAPHETQLPFLQPKSVPASDVKYFRPSFWSDLWPLDVGMMISNNALVPDPNKKDILASRPFDWLFMHLGLRMCG